MNSIKLIDPDEFTILTDYYVPLSGYTFFIPISHLYEYSITTDSNDINYKKEKDSLKVIIGANKTSELKQYQINLTSKWHDPIRLSFELESTEASIDYSLTKLSVSVASISKYGGTLTFYANSASHLDSYTDGIYVTRFKNIYQAIIPTYTKNKSYEIKVNVLGVVHTVYINYSETKDDDDDVTIPSVSLTPKVTSIDWNTTSFEVSYTLTNGTSISVTPVSNVTSCTIKDDSTILVVVPALSLTDLESVVCKIKVKPYNGTISGNTAYASVTHNPYDSSSSTHSIYYGCSISVPNNEATLVSITSMKHIIPADGIDYSSVTDYNNAPIKGNGVGNWFWIGFSTLDYSISNIKVIDPDEVLPDITSSIENSKGSWMGVYSLGDYKVYYYGDSNPIATNIGMIFKLTKI